MRSRIKKLERQADKEAVIVPQVDGPPLKFPKSVLREAFLHSLPRLRGEDIEPHPFTVAVAGSPEPNRYGGTFFAGEHIIVDRDGEPMDGVEDLSEG